MSVDSDASSIVLLLGLGEEGGTQFIKYCRCSPTYQTFTLVLDATVWLAMEKRNLERSQVTLVLLCMTSFDDCLQLWIKPLIIHVVIFLNI